MGSFIVIRQQIYEEVKHILNSLFSFDLSTNLPRDKVVLKRIYLKYFRNYL